MIFILLLKVFITFGLRLIKKGSANFSLFLFISPVLLAQHSLNFYGINENNELGFNLSSFNSNIGEKINTKDWEFFISAKSIYKDEFNITPEYFGLGKKISNHYFYFNISPGFQQKFKFSSSTKTIIGDTAQNFYSYLNYYQKYGFGYNYRINDQFGFGFNLSYFEQNFSEEFPTFYSDSVSNQTIWQIKEEEIDKNFWKCDFGFSYSPHENLTLSLKTNNLLILKDFDKEDNGSSFAIKTNHYNLRENKSVAFGVNYITNNNISFASRIESNKSFSITSNYLWNFSNSSLLLGTAIFHDNFQRPFFAGILPTINYSNELFSLTLSYLKYFSNRNSARNIEEFNRYHIHNLQNNYFSSDKIFLNLNFALSFKQEQLVEFVDAEVKNSIYPTFSENYINQPFATAEIKNLTDKSILVKPASLIETLNRSMVYSPQVSLMPNEIKKIDFFTVFESGYNDFSKPKISKVNFYVFVNDEDPHDLIQKPILINELNSWDGNVSNLKYFLQADLEFSKNYVNDILKSHGEINFQKEIKIVNMIKILFNNFAELMTYVADRRASSDRVQFPNETIEVKGGDCDDLAVCFSSQLESIGIQTAFIDYKPIDSQGHVTLLINTRLNPENSELLSFNERKYFIRQNINRRNEIWIPIEITKLTNFDDAWKIGSDEFYRKAVDNLGLVKGKVEIIDINY